MQLLLLLSSHYRTVLTSIQYLLVLFKAKKRISVVTSYNPKCGTETKKKQKKSRESLNTREKLCDKFLKITSSEKQKAG